MRKKLVNSQITNWNTYQMYLRQLLTLAENVFEYKNLPEYIDVAYLNKQLLQRGSIAFFKDDILDEVVALPYTNLGKLDIYGRPTKIRVMARNGYTKVLDRDEFVIMYDNNGRYPLYLDIKQFAERIGNSKKVIDTNISQQKTPRVWKTSSDKERTLRDLLNQYEGNIETIATYDNIDIDDINVVMAPAPYVADKIDAHLDKEWAEFFRLIGIANLTEQKKERLIQDELTASQGGTIASRYSRFEPRKRAINEINKKWNLNIEVSYYDGEPTTEEVESEDVVDDISLYDNTMVTN